MPKTAIFDYKVAYELLGSTYFVVKASFIRPF